MLVALEGDRAAQDERVGLHLRKVHGREARGERRGPDEGEERVGVRRGLCETLGEVVLGGGRGRGVVEGALEQLRVGPAALGVEEDDLEVPVRG